MALTRQFHRSIATFEHALVTGNQSYFSRATAMFIRGDEASAEAKHVPLWWSFRVARHLCDELWRNSLRVVLPADGGPELWKDLRERFIRMLIDRETAEVDLWPSQVRAASRVVDTRDDLVVALPTSAGKTRIAELCILRTLADERRVVYVTPLRALSAQIEYGLARTFRPLGISVTSVYGASGVAQSDLETLKSAKIVVATPEKLDFAVRQEPSVIDDIGLIVLDEGHMIGLTEREIRYEMLVQRLLRRPDADGRRLVCLSAVFAEGEAFDDFTAWLRLDAPGGPVRSVWRPTRQRPGRLVWTGTAGRLELDVDEERPFVPRFVEAQPAAKSRRVAFPNNAQEFTVAAASSFLSRGQTVLIYCPLKKSVEPTAEAFLKAHEQGYFASRLSAAQMGAIEAAVRIGSEWLGPDHPAVACLPLGVAVHHGSLPRQFLSEVEYLLRNRSLPVCVCSPTLAQGLDLCFSVLLFRSIYRSKKVIPAKEFANVVGRVGRAFVDLDGLYVLPIFEKDRRKARGIEAAFNSLVRKAMKRQLESGVKDLIGLIIKILSQRLGCDAHGLAEYVLNSSSLWSVEKKDGDQLDELLAAALNELDTAILGVIDALDLATDQVANYLDNCLQSSYWQRRLSRAEAGERELQSKVIQGRAVWLWNNTKPDSRRAYFSAGVGHAAGTAIEQSIDQLHALLSAAEGSLAANDTAEAGRQTALAAEILFKIGPFSPGDSVGDLAALLSHWLSGEPLSAYPDKSAVGFIQEHIVYRLVWAVEASRLHLQHLMVGLGEPPGNVLAMCLTYGVSSEKAALLMQGGVRRRSVAVAAALVLGPEVTDFGSLRSWLRGLREGKVKQPMWGSADEQREWDGFLARFDHRNHRQRKSKSVTLRVWWQKPDPPKAKTPVRVSRSAGGTDALVSSVSSLLLGEASLPDRVIGNYFNGQVQADRETIRISAFVGSH
jgi:superfamily II DNA/RNA helicase